MSDLEAIVAEHKDRKSARRDFLTRLGSAGLGVAAGAIIAGCGGGGSNNSISPTQAQTSGTPTAVDVLQFALNLEYLEAHFYKYATTGSGYTTNGFSTSNITNPPAPNLSGTALAVALELAQDELDHVLFLRSALSAAGVTPIAQPALNFGALGNVTNLATFLAVSRAFEDTGVSAYGGAAGILAGTPYLGPAAQILAVEAYHAGNLRLLIAQNGVTTTPTDAQDVLPPPSGTQYFTTYPSGANAGLAVVRTPAQVLGDVYGVSTATTVTPPTGVTSGGFFPQGVNGNIHST